MVRRRREASHSASQLEQNSVSSQEKATRRKKEVRTAGSSRKLKDNQQNQENKQPTMKSNCVSSRTRAKTQQKGLTPTEHGFLRSGRRRVQTKDEAAEDKSKAASSNPHPTPSSSSEAAPQTRSATGRHHNPATDSRQKTSTPNPSTSTHRHKNSGKKQSKTGRVNRNSNLDSDCLISIEEEKSDGTEDDSVRDSAEVEIIMEEDSEGVDRERGEVSRDGGRGRQGRRCSWSSSRMCRHQRATRAQEHGSSTHHQKVRAPFKRRWPGDDGDDSSAKKHPAPSKRKQVVTPTSESSPGNEAVQDQQEQLQNVSQVHSRPDVRCWLDTFKLWGNAERLMALDDLIQQCEVPQVRHMMLILQPHFQRDFISLLPKEVALHVLSYLKPRDLMKAAQTCRYWRTLCEDNLLWREKCEEEGIGNALFSSICAKDQSAVGCFKTLFLQQTEIENNWRRGPLRPPVLLKSHEDHVITCLEFCGQRIVSGSDDYTLKVWSAVTGKCLRTLVGHTGGVWSSQMSGNILISGSTDRSLRVWNADTGECKHVLYGHTSTVRCLSLYGKKVVSGSRDATLRMWDIETGVCLHMLFGHVAAVRCVLYDGKHVVSGAYDYTVRIWKPETETCLHVLRGHTNRVYSLQFDGVHIASGSLDTSIRVWNVNTGKCLQTLLGHQSLTSGLELKDNILVSGNADSTVKVWDITTGHCLHTLQGPNKHQSAVTCLQFNKKFVVTSSDDGTVKIWDLHTGEYLRDLVALPSGGSGGVVWRLRCSNTQMVCAVGSRNGTEDTKLILLDFDVHEKKDS